MAGDALLRVGGVEDENGVEYEHARSEPEDSYPQTVYFYVPDEAAGEVERLVGRLSEEHGYDAEVL